MKTTKHKKANAVEPLVVPDLYRCLYDLKENGYIVYRHSFKAREEFADNSGFLAAVKYNKTAVFVMQSEAVDYCVYRNRLTAKRGTDRI